MPTSSPALSAADVLSALSTFNDPDLGLGIQFLGALSLDDRIREGADSRRPAAAVAGPSAGAFQGLVRHPAAQVSIRSFRRLPVIQVR